MHITKESFNEIINNNKMFKLEGMFYGTKEQFQDNFFTNVTYENVIDFANEYDCYLEEYNETI